MGYSNLGYTSIWESRETWLYVPFPHSLPWKAAYRYFRENASHTLQEHYSTKDPMINETLQSCETLFCIDDIICQVHVYDFNHAKIILKL